MFLEIKRVIKGEPPHGDDDLDGDAAKSESKVKESVIDEQKTNFFILCEPGFGSSKIAVKSGEL